MLCSCHGEPAYWNPDPKMRAGGHWRCAVKKRQQQLITDRGRADVKNERMRDRYDRDWVYRIEKQLSASARERRRRLQRRREETVG